MIPRLLRAVLVAMFGVLPLADAARACQCMPPGSPRGELATSHAVFVGVVEHQAGPYRIPTGHDDSYRESNRWFRLRVVAAWKGVREEQDVVVVLTSPSGGMCGYDFTVGEAYIVYAYSSRDTLATSICDRTAPLHQAQVDLAELGAPAIDRRADRSSWNGYGAPTICPKHDGVRIQKDLMTSVYRLPASARQEFERIVKSRFPYPGLRFPSTSERGHSEQSLLCSWCREEALEWCYANGAVCADEIFGGEAVDPAPPSERRAPERSAQSDAAYRKRFPFGNFAFRFDDGRLWSYDSIDGRLTLRRKAARDTMVKLQLETWVMRDLYDRMIANRAFDLPAPNPGPHDAKPQASAGACDRASLYVRSDTLVRMYSWRLRSAPAAPAAAGHDGWRRLDDMLRAVLGALVARPEARALLAVPIR